MVGKLRWLPVGAAVLVAMLLLTGIVFAVASAGDADDSPPDPTTGSRTRPPRSTSTARRSRRGARPPITDCAEHAYGDVQVWLQHNRCDELVRMRFESTTDGKRAAVLVSVLRFQQSAAAAGLNEVADKPGSGAIVDAAAEGKPWPGDHKPSFESAAFASGREGNSLKLVQVVWIGAPSTPDDANLVKLADAALDLTAP